MTSIEWTDETWNPVRGCSKVSKGCEHCYAMKQAHRWSGPGQPYAGLTKLVPGKGPQWTGQVRCVPEMLKVPLRWRQPRRIFVNSMSDLFHPEIPEDFIASVFAVMALAWRHTYQVLTKRADLMAVIIAHPTFEARVRKRAWEIEQDVHPLRIVRRDWAWPLPNVWLGTSVEDQATADERIPHLLRTPAAVRCVSCEPLLGPVRLERDWLRCPGGAEYGHGLSRTTVHAEGCCDGHPVVSWIIVGGESGPRARPCRVEWIRSVVAQCRAAGAAVFVKQLGSRPVLAADDEPTRLRSRKGTDWTEWPDDLRFREWPA